MTDATGTTAEAKAPGTAELMREQRLQRNLKILVGGMGALILVGVGAVIVKMVSFGTAPRTSSALTASSVAEPAGEIALELPKGAKIVSVSVSGNRLAVHYESPTGAGIAVIDLDTGRRMVDFKPLEAVPRN